MTTNRWRPDTCGCILEYSFDADLPPMEQVHTPQLVDPCLAHRDTTTTNLPDPGPDVVAMDWPHEKQRFARTGKVAFDDMEAQFIHARNDNRRKNVAYRIAKELHPDVPDEDFTFEWEFGPKRELRVKRIMGTTPSQAVAARLAAMGGDVRADLP